MSSRSGIYRTNLSGQAEYKSFLPSPLPPDPPITLDEDALSVLVQAHEAIAALESISTRIPNMELFISMYVRKEALMSSQIEGTQATLEDIFDPTIERNANRDVAEVVNYVKATQYAIERLDELPLCNRLLKETHAVLMESVRGQEKNPGEFRRSQNWIGGQGSFLKDARYIPPNPEDMAQAMSDLEKYMNSDSELDVLVRAALIHYQFETIHPFLDGNGRIGRLLIILFLMEKKVLTTPALYISYFLKKHRIEYYDRMTEVRAKGNYEQWVSFFLSAVCESAHDAIVAIDEMTVLRNKNCELIKNMGRAAANTMVLFEYVEANPIIDITTTSQRLGLSYNTVSSATQRLVEAGILVQTNTSSRNRTYMYKEYLDILAQGTE